MVEVTLAVLLMVEPPASLLLACRTTVNVAVAPLASVAIVSLMLPLGFVVVKVGPAVCGCTSGTGTPVSRATRPTAARAPSS